MPHIVAVFPEGAEVRRLLRLHKFRIRELITEELGYSLKDTALIPNAIPPPDQELMDNVLPLEIVVESGTKTLNLEQWTSDHIKERLLEAFSEMRGIQFGVWVKSHAKNGYSEHNPATLPPAA